MTTTRTPAARWLSSALLGAALVLPALPAQSDDGYNLPTLGDTSSSMMSREQEYQLGRTWLTMLRGAVPTLEDPQLKSFVESRVYALAETSQLADRRLAFVMIDSPQLNAFAAPGGVVGVNAGLFLHAQTEAEFASVMAHELAHLSQRHFARGLEQQQKMQVPFMTAMLASIILAAAGGGDAGFAALASTQAAAIQEQRRFSRQNEQEADRIGLTNLVAAGYDPLAMPNMFERLAQLSRFDSTPPEFLLTHPVSQSRMADTRNRAAQLPVGGEDDTVEYQMMRARVQIHYESSPGLSAKRFGILLDEHDGNHDAARYGLALALTRGGQHDQAEETLAPLLEKEPHNLTVALAQVEIDNNRGRLASALTRTRELLRNYPGNYPLQFIEADLLLKQQNYAAAEQAINRLASQRTGDPDVWYLAAEIRGLAGNILGVHLARAEYFMLTGDTDQAGEQLDLALKRANGSFVMSSRIRARQDELARQRRQIESL
ncbi:M48 family metalloprotease [Pseudomonas sp. 5Ae-yellow]|uniref:M48 family metalloprotease n=1 Tax=Pseudomonas sp. 5Ae-yellow TaxID=2759848 RepID=UPI0015F763A6|nr:M48 family metalloprotease [Pseudomonas sp. 5Ae-yellow]MBA6421417.1 M48 family metallopeptidase [Pseudomonas sp. 5Ae-yellow]